jgi:hypothetical protein
MKVTHRSYVPDGPGEIKLIPEEGGCSSSPVSAAIASGGTCTALPGVLTLAAHSTLCLTLHCPTAEVPGMVCWHPAEMQQGGRLEAACCL